MKAAVKLWKSESALIVGVVLAVIDAGLVPGTWAKFITAIVPLLGAGAIRQTVFAPSTVQRLVQVAAASVASQLAPHTVGVAGVVPPSAQAVVDGVTAGAIGALPTVQQPPV